MLNNIKKTFNFNGISLDFRNILNYFCAFIFYTKYSF